MRLDNKGGNEILYMSVERLLTLIKDLAMKTVGKIT